MTNALERQLTSLRQRYLMASETAPCFSHDLLLGNGILRLHFIGDRIKNFLMPALNVVPAVGNDPDFTIFIWEDAFLPGSSEYATAMQAYPDKVSVSHADMTHITFNPEGCILSIADTQRKCGYYCVKDASQLPDYEVCTPMRTLLHWVCYSLGLVFTHAAAVGVNGSGVLLAGRSGAGKSSTALACLMGGLQFVGDDYVAVSVGQEITAYAIYRGCKVTDAALPHFEPLHPYLIKTNKTQEKNVLILTPEAGALEDKLLIGALIRPHIAMAEHTSLSPMSATAYLMEIATSTVLQTQGGGEYTLAALSSMCRCLSAFSMQLSADFTEIAQSMREQLTKGALYLT